MKIEFAEMVLKQIIEEKKTAVTRRLAVMLADQEEIIEKLYKGVPIDVTYDVLRVDELCKKLSKNAGSVISNITGICYTPNSGMVAFNCDNTVTRWFKYPEDAAMYKETGKYDWNVSKSMKTEEYTYEAAHTFEHTSTNEYLRNLGDLIHIEYV